MKRQIRLSQLKADKVFETLLKDHGVEIPIYTRQLPTSSLPKEFIWIVQNGSYRNRTLNKTFYETTLAVNTECRLTSVQTVNDTMENILVGKIEDIIGKTRSIIIDNTERTYTYLYLDGGQLCLEDKPLAIVNEGAVDKYEVIFELSNNAVSKSAYPQAQYSIHTTNINVQILKK